MYFQVILSDKDMEQMVASCPDLRQLVLSNLTTMTFGPLFQPLTQLHALTLDNRWRNCTRSHSTTCLWGSSWHPPWPRCANYKGYRASRSAAKRVAVSSGKYCDMCSTSAHFEASASP